MKPLAPETSGRPPRARGATPKRGRVAVAGVAVGLFVLVLAGPRARFEEDWEEARVGGDVEAYLDSVESRIPDLRPGDGKRVVWADPETSAPTPRVVVYLHGFTADGHELEPLVSSLASDLGANAYFARLAGHGRAPAALGRVRASDWLSDAAEAMAVAERLGTRVVLMGTSTGGTLATWIALQPEWRDRLDALVLVSPNFHPRDGSSRLLLWPWGGLIARVVVGPERCYETWSEAHARHWTECHPTRALLPMMALVEHVRTADLSTIDTPLLVAYSREDKVVDPAEIERAYHRFGSERRRLVEVRGVDDPDRHVLAGAILSPSTTEALRREIRSFLGPP